MLAKDGLPIGDWGGFYRVLHVRISIMCKSGSRFPIMIVPIGFEGSGGSFSIIAFNQDIKHHILLWTFNLMHELLNKLKNKD